ncbi:hypothetical protein [uncultured Mediterranea sp.]|uniref:hypothetical protein n=1 Tax=uncultured Mediterranea sp. TaxID=1926662 RepID=UPI002805CFE4|nr:hypothetical protein [uncultured Mediterranea sp.]
MRRYENLQYGDEKIIRKSLDVLADKTTGVEAYRNAFEMLGVELGRVLAQKAGDVLAEETMLVCASEDADWLAKGVENGFGKGELPVSIYWNTRNTVYQSENGEKIEISPIVKAYEEPIAQCRLLVIVKSIISSSCVVKTQLTRLIDRINPEKIAIMAPVMYKDAQPNLLKEFPEKISNKFLFLQFAVDEDRQGNEVIPGIGGMVYPRLGLGDINKKNQYIPHMVRMRM